MKKHWHGCIVYIEVWVSILSSFGEVIKVMKKVIGSCRILTAQNTLNLVQENFLKIVVVPPITARLLFFSNLA